MKRQAEETTFKTFADRSGLLVSLYLIIRDAGKGVSAVSVDTHRMMKAIEGQ